MRLKSMLLASCVGAVGLAAVGPAEASAGWYGSFFGGYDKSSAGGISTSRYDNAFPGGDASGFSDHYSAPQSGFLVGAAIGYDLSDAALAGLKVEAELAYRHENVDGHASLFSDTVSPLVAPFGVGGAGFTSSSAHNADLTNWSLMANLQYEFDLGSRLKPYIMGGAGWSREKFNFKLAGPSYKPSESEGFAYQLGAGVNWHLSPHSSIGLGYRYFTQDDLIVVIPNSGDDGIPSQTATYSGTHQDVMLNLSYDLN